MALTWIKIASTMKLFTVLAIAEAPLSTGEAVCTGAVAVTSLRYCAVNVSPALKPSHVVAAVSTCFSGVTGPYTLFKSSGSLDWKYGVANASISAEGSVEVMTFEAHTVPKQTLEISLSLD